MSIFTPLNIEQSIAKYLATKFIEAGYKIYWYDTGQQEGTGSVIVTLLRDFPPNATALVRQSATPAAGQVRVPAFSIVANAPGTTSAQRMGIGEAAFEWSAMLRLDGFADTELQWYKFHNMFKDWFGPDTYITLYDQESDINSDDPTAAEQKIHLLVTQTNRMELDYDSAARYYIMLVSTATFIE